MTESRRVVVALDSFKGAISSREAGEAVRRGLLSRAPTMEVTVFSVGDGGEGTAAALCDSLGAKLHTMTVSDTHGKPIAAEYGIATIGGKTIALLDMATAAGIRYAAAHNFAIHLSTTRGVGEMLAALAGTVDEIVVGLGGSGTSDGGIGALASLGAHFYDVNGTEIAAPTTGALASVASCDLTLAQQALADTKLTLLYDVAVPLTGEVGAVRLFSRQKGASEDDIPALENAMARYANICDAAVGNAVSAMPGAGAAGGLGYGLALLGGTLTPGAPYVLDAIGFTDAIAHADAVITGEGRTDAQTAVGKLPMMVAAASGGVPVVCLCGAADPVPALYESGMTAVFAIADRPMTLEDSLRDTSHLVEKAAYNLAGLLLRMG